MDLLALTIQPVIYFMVLVSVIVHGLSIPFFSLGRRVHSISRTWTSQSGTGPEPSWLSRVRRVGDPRDVEINHDDSESPPPGEKTETQDSSETAYARTDTGRDSEKTKVNDSPSEKVDLKQYEARDYGFDTDRVTANQQRLIQEDCERIRPAEEEGAEIWDEGDAVRTTVRSLTDAHRLSSSATTARTSSASARRASTRANTTTTRRRASTSIVAPRTKILIAFDQPRAPRSGPRPRSAPPRLLDLLLQSHAVTAPSTTSNVVWPYLRMPRLRVDRCTAAAGQQSDSA